MGWFTRRPRTRTAPAEDTVRPLSQERLTGILDAQGWHWVIDEDGDLGGNWEGNTFWFFLTGSDREVLQVQGALRDRLSLSELDALRLFIEDWHRDHYWPKCSYRVEEEDATVQLLASHTIDHEAGATDAQLLQQIRCALGTANQVFEAARETFALGGRTAD
ncbi:YbjN domain-containing protein [Actinomyces polynesiensis]|uniref:YbjN domain-containing protein n=1 Tax=Actinomyces polynesiensis TaxID=1325934 RepID=UPI0005BD07F7|nr:YbjN domain-containing protein [Actinomyces polynesiensis]